MIPQKSYNVPQSVALFSIMQGGNPGRGFASGLASSLTASTVQNLGGGKIATVIGGSLSGGVGASVVGGDFYQGAVFGLISSSLNHVAHEVFNQNTVLRDVTIEVTDKIVGSTTLKGYPGNSANSYEVPTYEMSVTGTDSNGNSVTYTFEVVRFGVKDQIGKSAYVQGVPAGSYKIDWYDSKYLGSGGFHIKGNYLLHAGVDYGSRMGNNGCVSIMGRSNWGLFKSNLISLTGTNSYSSMIKNSLLTINIWSASQPPLIKSN